MQLRTETLDATWILSEIYGTVFAAHVGASWSEPHRQNHFVRESWSLHGVTVALGLKLIMFFLIVVHPKNNEHCLFPGHPGVSFNILCISYDHQSNPAQRILIYFVSCCYSQFYCTRLGWKKMCMLNSHFHQDCHGFMPVFFCSFNMAMFRSFGWIPMIFPPDSHFFPDEILPLLLDIRNIRCPWLVTR